MISLSAILARMHIRRAMPLSQVTHDALARQYNSIRASRDEHRRIAAEAKAYADDCDVVLAALNEALIPLEVLQPVRALANDPDWMLLEHGAG